MSMLGNVGVFSVNKLSDINITLHILLNIFISEDACLSRLFHPNTVV